MNERARTREEWAQRHRDHRMLEWAARHARQAAGHVEPNPTVGCVIARGETVVAIGWHQKYGGLHAEREALEDAARRGVDVRGCTMYVTLEPCCHTGKQPPCTEAVLEAGISEVVVARVDPGEVSRGGAEILRAAGVPVRFTDASLTARAISDPFVKRVTEQRPWVIAKWAQTIDGRVATRTGESQWISGPESRADVHQTRGRMDAILTGIGTALTDDPRLTARPLLAQDRRRVARRVLLDSSNRLTPDAALVRTLDVAPLTIVSASDPAEPIPNAEHWVCPGTDGRVDLRETLRRLAETHDVSNVLVESGPVLLGSMLEADLIDECHVYIAPILMGDDQALPALSGCVTSALSDATRFDVLDIERFGPADTRFRLRRRQPDDAPRDS